MLEALITEFGSIEDLMSFSEDTEMRIVAPLHRRVDVEAAGRLQLSSDVVDRHGAMAMRPRLRWPGSPMVSSASASSASSPSPMRRTHGASP